MNLRFVTYLAAVVAVAIGVGMLVSAVVSGIYGDPDLVELLISAAICLVLALPAYAWSRKAARAYIGFREAFVAVAVSWVFATVLGAIPYMLVGVLGPLDALFESISGFTTTGASVLTDFVQPHGIMFWRSLTHWYGGMGIVVLFLAVLPAVGGGAIRLFTAEAPGPVSQRLTPRLRDTARRLWYLYVGISAAEVLLLMAVGLEPFSAVTHTFGTMATGGFSPEPASIGGLHNWAAELVIVIFMIIAGGNFALYLWVLAGRGREALRDAELRLYLGLLLGSTVLVGLSLLIAGSHQGPVHAFREALFQVVSIQTTTGYVTADFDAWNSFARTLLVMLMFVGGCAGSTAGGMKVVRLLLLWKSAHRTLAQAVHPRAVIPVRVSRRVVRDNLVVAVLGFFFLYVTLFAVGTLLVATSNVGLVTAATAVAATLNNVGPGLELVGATLNYAPIAPFGKVVLMAMMLLGRLELLPIMLPFTRVFWKR